MTGNDGKLCDMHDNVKSRLEDAGRTLCPGADLARIVAHGYRLAVENGREEPKLRDAVWELLIEAFETLNALPDQEITWLLAGERAHHPQVMVEDIEKDEWERTLNALSLGEKLRVLGPVRIKAGKEAIDRMDEVIRWPAQIRTKNRRRDVAVLVYLAGGVSVSKVRKIFGLKRRNVYDIRDRGLAHLVTWIGVRLAEDDTT